MDHFIWHLGSRGSLDFSRTLEDGQLNLQARSGSSVCLLDWSKLNLLVPASTVCKKKLHFENFRQLQ